MSGGGPQREPSMDALAAPSGACGVRVCGAGGEAREGAEGHVRGRARARARNGGGCATLPRSGQHARAHTHTRSYSSRLKAAHVI